MQDRYAGDLGDFLKLGLLRWLVAPARDEQPLRLGVVWYLTADESHNADGKHVAYLDSAHRHAGRLRALDVDLYERLATLVLAGRRNVDELERSGVLPPETPTHRSLLNLTDLPVGDRSGRLERRCTWLSAALSATQGCDVVFLDPDNGLRPSGHRVPRHRTKSVKHAYLDEVAAFARRGQSVVAYHHADRSAPVAEQARRRMAELAEVLDAVPLATGPLGAVQASRGTTRLFLVAPATAHVDRLSRRLRALEQSPWSAELKVHWFRRSDAEPPDDE